MSTDTPPLTAFSRMDSIRDCPRISFAVYRLRRTNVIEVQHLTKRYGRVTAVDDVSFRVERGEILGFLGPNGAGKTTTMRILTGYMPATAGKAIVAGFDVFDQPIEAKKRTGYLPETPPLYPDMSVAEYLAFVAKIKGVPPAERSQRIRTVMERTRIADMANRLCSRLSKGYRQRVGLAQAIIHNPDVLILDEPTAGLDPKQIIETRRLIKELAGDHTIILSTHILSEVEQSCSKVIIINEGSIVAVDSVAALHKRGRTTELVSIEVAGTDGFQVKQRLEQVPGVARVISRDSRSGNAAFEVEGLENSFIRPDLAPKGMTTIIVALFFLSGMQLTFIGILGEYVTSIHSQVRKRPLVVERERLNMGANAPSHPVHELQKKIADAA